MRRSVSFLGPQFGAPTPSGPSSAAKRSITPRPVSRGVSEMFYRKSVKSDHADVNPALVFLRERHPVKTADSVAAETGISANTVAQWFKGNSRPGWAHTNALISAYGPEFLAAVCPSCRSWLDPVLQERRQQELERRQAELDQQFLALKAKKNEKSGMAANFQGRNDLGAPIGGLGVSVRSEEVSGMDQEASRRR